MSAQHGAVLPHRPATPGEQHWLPAASTLVVVVSHARCSWHRTRGHRWPCVRFNCSSFVEQFANGSAVFWVTGHFLTPAELFERSSNWHRACQTTLLLRDSLSLSLQLFAVAATLKSINYNVAMTFILNNNNNTSHLCIESCGKNWLTVLTMIQQK